MPLSHTIASGACLWAYPTAEINSGDGGVVVTRCDRWHEVLLTQQEQQEQMRIKAGARWQEHGLVFCNRYGEFLVEWWYTSAVFHKLLAQAGLPVLRFHDSRHSMATMLLAAGVHPKVVFEEDYSVPSR